jgi:predicted RNase H-like HicB family nuclease
LQSKDIPIMKRLQNYTMVIRPDDNGTFAAYIPAIPGCHAWGKTQEDAQAELDSVFEMIFLEYKENGLPMPDDVELKLAYAH